jgi:hypothetical protein
MGRINHLIVFIYHFRWRAAKSTVDPWSTLRAFEQGGIFIVPHLLWHGTSVFPLSQEEPPPSNCFYRLSRGPFNRLFGQGRNFIVPHLLWHGTDFSSLIRRTALFNRLVQLARGPFNRLLRLAMKCGGPILTRILTGSHSLASYDTQGNAEDLSSAGSLRVFAIIKSWITLI